MSKTNNCYKIYAHINKENGKIYIGQTKQTLNNRFMNGYGYRTCPHFWNAIQKYGWDNFEHIVLFENISLELANIIEEELIEKYNTRNSLFGYNINFGGDNHVIPEETKKKMKEKAKECIEYL